MWRQKFFAIDHFWPASKSLLNYSPIRSPENWEPGVFIFYLAKSSIITSPHPVNYVPNTQRMHLPCASTDMHGFTQTYKYIHTLPGWFLHPGFFVSSGLAPVEIVYLPACQPHQISTSFMEHTPLSCMSLSQQLAVLN